MSEAPEPFKRAKSQPVVGLASGVTGETYARLGSQFIQARGHGFVIAKRNIPAKRDGDGEDVKATPRQWGAWLAYLAHIGYRNNHLLKADYWTVPAEWPHLFDASASVVDDYQAADDYERAQAFERSQQRYSVREVDFRKAARNWRNLSVNVTVPQFFPALWVAFGADPEIRPKLDLMSWDEQCQASRKLAAEGAWIARAWLEVR
jgi:hypothetical protein